MEFFNSLVQWVAAVVTGLVMWIILAGSSVSPQIKIQTPLPASTTRPAATSTPAKIATSTTKTATTTKAATTTKPKVATAVVQPATAPSTPPPAPTDITNEVIAKTNAEARASVVNIFCSLRTANTYSYISGSGIVIDARGVIVTNAHIAQFFLLQDYPGSNTSSCIVRTGSPATPAYKASLLYIPTVWITQNASQILSENATGTGERDYALLYITGPTQYASTLPASFASLSISTDTPKLNYPVLLAGYPAGFLDSTGVQRSLYPTSAVSTIKTLYTFNSAANTDVISLGGTAVAQGGSSGGAVIDLVTDKVVGLISTESGGETTAARDLRAITFGYINRSLIEDGKGGIYSLLAGDLSQKSKNFTNDVVPTLAQKLIDAILK